MAELRVALDPLTGALLVEDHRLPGGLAADLATLPGAPRPIACARPAEARSPEPLASTDGHATGVRVAGYWHASLVDGPGRRSVAKLQGCPIRCHGFLCSAGTTDGTLQFLQNVDRIAV